MSPHLAKYVLANKNCQEKDRGKRGSIKWKQTRSSLYFNKRAKVKFLSKEMIQGMWTAIITIAEKKPDFLHNSCMCDKIHNFNLIVKLLESQFFCRCFPGGSD